MKKNIFKQGFVCFLSCLILLMPFSEALSKGDTRKHLSETLKTRIIQRDIVWSKKAKHGVRVELLKNPKDYDAGVIVVGTALGILAMSMWLYNTSAKISRQPKHLPFSDKLIRSVGVEGVLKEGISKSLEKIMAATIGKSIFQIAGMILDAPETVINIVAQFGGITNQEAGLYINTVNDYKDNFGRSSAIDSEALMVESIEKNGIIPSHEFAVINIVDNTPQTISFSETFSGFNSATPDFTDSPNSTLTFSDLIGERTGVLQGGLIQNMHGRFEAYEGSANTLVNVPISGSITGIGIFIHGRPISLEAMLLMDGIGDFRTAMGPFTINPNGTSAGTFYGHTFYDFEADPTPTGDVVLYYSANPQ